MIDNSEKRNNTSVEKVYFLNLGYIPVEGIESTPKDTTPDNTGLMYAIAIKYKEGIILYDTGIGTDPTTLELLEAAKKHNLVKAETISPVARLEELGYSADDVTHVIISHMHVDHFGHIYSFKKAKVYITQKEYDGTMGAYLNGNLSQEGAMSQLIPEYMIKMFVDESVDFEIMKEPIVELIPGVTIYNFGNGHSFGISALMIETRNSENFFAISDIAYTANSLNSDFKVSFNICDEGYEATKRAVKNIAQKEKAVILTGHDPELINTLKWSTDGYYE